MLTLFSKNYFLSIEVKTYPKADVAVSWSCSVMLILLLIAKYFVIDFRSASFIIKGSFGEQKDYL